MTAATCRPPEPGRGPAPAATVLQQTGFEDETLDVVLRPDA